MIRIISKQTKLMWMWFKRKKNSVNSYYPKNVFNFSRNASMYNVEILNFITIVNKALIFSLINGIKRVNIFNEKKLYNFFKNLFTSFFSYNLGF